VDRFAEKLARVSEDKVDRGDFQAPPLVEGKQEGILLGHAIKAPGVIGGGMVQIADLLHPLAAPGARVKEGNHTKGAGHGVGECAQVGSARGECRPLLVGGVQEKVPAPHALLLEPVTDTPIHEEGALVLQGSP